MTKIPRLTLFISIFSLILIFALPRHAQEEGIVLSIKVQGNKRVDESTILYYIKTETGKPLSRMQIRKDIEQIYSLGQFKDIQVDTRALGDGLEVVFTEEEIASIGDIRISGNYP